MTQSRVMSAVEAGANVAVGWCIALGTQLLLFPVVGLQVTVAQSPTISGAFTGGIAGAELRPAASLRAHGQRACLIPPTPITLTDAQAAEIETLDSPWLSIANKQMELMARYMAELGLTPSARRVMPEGIEANEPLIIFKTIYEWVDRSTGISAVPDGRRPMIRLPPGAESA